MTARRWHRYFGIVLALPCVCWALTGAIFFLKPGYEGAYEIVALPGGSGEILEERRLHTPAGEFLLLRESSGWRNVEPDSRRERPLPDDAALRELMARALAANAGRYGQIRTIEPDPATRSARFTTTTGVRLSLDWDTLAISQRGADTDWIDRLYRIHYIQWTGIALLDRALGAAALAGILGLAVLGVRLFFRPPR